MTIYSFSRLTHLPTISSDDDDGHLRRLIDPTAISTISTIIWNKRSEFIHRISTLRGLCPINTYSAIGIRFLVYNIWLSALALRAVPSMWRKWQLRVGRMLVFSYFNIVWILWLMFRKFYIFCIDRKWNQCDNLKRLRRTNLFVCNSYISNWWLNNKKKIFLWFTIMNTIFV